MSHEEINDEDAKATVTSEIGHAKEFIKNIDFDEVRSGEWFLKLLRQVITSYDKNAQARYFQQKYPGLSSDEIADKLITVTVKYAAIVGAVTGITVSANQIAVLGTGGMTAPLLLTSIGVEMIALSLLQIRLVLQLATVYDLHLDPDDPEDILMIFGYAIGVQPSELLGKGVQIAGGEITKTAIKTYITKGTLKAVQDFARQLGFKILQRTIIKYAVPAVSAAVGSSYNYTSTLAVGKIAKSHFKNRGKVTEEIRALISRQYTYDLVYPAAVKFVAQIDGEFSDHEREFYNAILSRMSFEPHTQLDFAHLNSEYCTQPEQILLFFEYHCD